MFIMKQPLSLVVVAAGLFIMNANPTNASALRHLSKDSLDSRDAEAEVSIQSKTDLDSFAPAPDEAKNSIGTTYDSIISMIKPDFLGAVTPNSVSIFGCARADDNDELESIITAAEPGGEVRLCPGKVEFDNEIRLTKSITITCAGPKFSCIFDGNGLTRHFYGGSKSDLAFSGIAFINGQAYDGGSVYSSGYSENTTILFDRCLFFNNRAYGSISYGSQGGALYVYGKKTVVNNCVFLENVAKVTSSEDSSIGGAINVLNGDLSVLDSTFKNNGALQVNPSASAIPLNRGGAIHMVSTSFCANGGCNLLVVGSVFELNEASTEGGAVYINNSQASVKVGWINNNALLFDNTAGETCDGVFVSTSVDGTTSTECVSVGDNFSV